MPQTRLHQEAEEPYHAPHKPLESGLKSVPWLRHIQVSKFQIQVRLENSTMHGGKRSGAGRPPGAGWKPSGVKTKPKIAPLSKEVVEQHAAIVGGDPLSVVAAMVLDTSLDVGLRLSAANCCLPFLYPRLSSTTVDAKMTVTKVDSADLLRRLDERLARMATPATIEVKAEEPPLAITIEPDEDA